MEIEAVGLTVELVPAYSSHSRPSKMESRDVCVFRSTSVSSIGERRRRPGACMKQLKMNVRAPLYAGNLWARGKADACHAQNSKG